MNLTDCSKAPGVPPVYAELAEARRTGAQKNWQQCPDPTSFKLDRRIFV
jgi:hypothetical protein